jgi:hypothetical protein
MTRSKLRSISASLHDSKLFLKVMGDSKNNLTLHAFKGKQK